MTGPEPLLLAGSLIMRRFHLKARHGFSLLELVVVVAIMLAIAAYAIPNLLSAIGDYKLRNTMSQVAAICQQRRIQAVRANSTVVIDGAVIANALPRGVTSSLPSTISGAPNFNTNALANYNAQAQSVPVQFNARGLPCVGIATACSNWDTANNEQVGFLIYFKMDKTLGGSGYGAITITPAGRIRTWFYTASAYAEL